MCGSLEIECALEAVHDMSRQIDGFKEDAAKGRLVLEAGETVSSQHLHTYVSTPCVVCCLHLPPSPFSSPLCSFSPVHWSWEQLQRQWALQWPSCWLLQTRATSPTQARPPGKQPRHSRYAGEDLPGTSHVCTNAHAHSHVHTHIGTHAYVQACTIMHICAHVVVCLVER